MAKNNMRIILFCSYLLLTNLCYSQTDVRQSVVDTLLAQVGVTELTGHNDGVAVEKFLKAVGLPKGFAWCSALGCWAYKVNDAPNPNNAAASSWFIPSKVIYSRETRKFKQEIRQGDAGGVWFENPRGIHHVVFILKWNGSIAKTVEGNTSDVQGIVREGGGCYIKYRSCKQIYQVASWIR